MALDPNRIREIQADPDFQRLVHDRRRFAGLLTVLMLLIYFGFILLIAFEPKWLGHPLFGGVTTVGIPVGLGVIISAFVLVGLYVARANSTYDALTERLLERHK